jgi:hypothetical protein
VQQVQLPPCDLLTTVEHSRRQQYVQVQHIAILLLLLLL